MEPHPVPREQRAGTICEDYELHGCAITECPQGCYLTLAAKQRAADLHASERAMQMIAATMCGGGSNISILADVDRIVNAWVHHAGLLTNTVMVEELPLPESWSIYSVHLYNEVLKRNQRPI